jgi:hypothetical protein
MIILLTILGFIYSKKMVYQSTDLKTYFGNRTENEERFKLANGFLKHLGLLSSLFYVFVCCSEMFFEWNFLLAYVPIRNLRING